MKIINKQQNHLTTTVSIKTNNRQSILSVATTDMIRGLDHDKMSKGRVVTVKSSKS